MHTCRHLCCSSLPVHVTFQYLLLLCMFDLLVACKVEMDESDPSSTVVCFSQSPPHFISIPELCEPQKKQTPYSQPHIKAKLCEPQKSYWFYCFGFLSSQQNAVMMRSKIQLSLHVDDRHTPVRNTKT